VSAARDLPCGLPNVSDWNAIKLIWKSQQEKFILAKAHSNPNQGQQLRVEISTIMERHSEEDFRKESLFSQNSASQNVNLKLSPTKSEDRSELKVEDFR
jgi:Ulp1 family protease